MTEDLDHLAGEYVLGTLDRTSRQAVERRMPQEPDLRRAVDAWETRLAPLTQSVEPVPLPPHLWPRIDASLRQSAAPRATLTPPSTFTRWWNSLFVWRGVGLSGLATAAVLATVLLTQTAPPPAAPQFMVVLVAPQDKAPGWVVQASHRREIQLIPLGTTPVPTDKALEFWTKADGWNGPVSLGLVKPGQPLLIPLDRLPPLQANQLFELTLEPPTGSPTGKPTGPIQFIGRAVRVI